MTTKHDSFDASGHGFFVRSAHGMRNSAGRVLIWVNRTADPEDYPAASITKSLYAEFGVAADYRSSFAGLDSYTAIIFIAGSFRLDERTPTWWPDVQNWRGRLLIAPGPDTGFINSLSSVTGMTVGSIIRPGPLVTVERILGPLAEGIIDGLPRGEYWPWRGGTPLDVRGEAWIAERRMGDVSFVGDSGYFNHTVFARPDSPFPNSLADFRTFLSNLISVEVT